MLDVYADFAINEAAVPVIKGVKSETEKFAGAMSTTIEGMMGDTRALQSGLAFPRAELRQGLQYPVPGPEQHPAVRLDHLLGSLHPFHRRHHHDARRRPGPDPASAPGAHPGCHRADLQERCRKGQVMEAANRVFKELKAAGIRLKVDDREGSTPGFKYNDWEMRGVPLRIEIGPKDVEKGSVALARRDIPGRDGKSFVPQANLAATVSELAGRDPIVLLARATAFRDANIHEPKNYAELKEVVQNGWAFSWWCESKECEAKVKEDTKATTRTFPSTSRGTASVSCAAKKPRKKSTSPRHIKSTSSLHVS